MSCSFVKPGVKPVFSRLGDESSAVVLPSPAGFVFQLANRGNREDSIMECSIQWRKDFPSQLKRASALRILELLLVVAVPFALLGATNFTQNSYSYSSVNYINQENQRPGTTRWQSIELNKVRDQQIKLISNPLEVTSQLRTDADYGGSTIANETWTDTKIRGYASETSINHGDSIKLYVSTGQPSYNLEVYRMGWYQGTGARLMLTVSNLPGQNQLVPTPEANTGLIECNWQISYTLKTLSSWVSGVYLVKLIARMQQQQISFIKYPLLLIKPITTGAVRVFMTITLQAVVPIRYLTTDLMMIIVVLVSSF